MSDDSRVPQIAWVKQYVQGRMDGLCEILGGEMGRIKKAERERIAKDFEMLRRALEIQANRIAALEEQLGAEPKHVRALVAGRAL